MAKDTIYIEPLPNGGFGAKHEGGKRAFITADTQGAVIEDARAKHPGAAIHVAPSSGCRPRTG